MAEIKLPYGKSTLSVTIRDEWLGEVVRPRPVEAARNLQTLIAAALDNPIGTLPLAQLAKPGQQVALIVDDYTRKTPVHLFLPLVLDCLLAAGVARGAIRIVVASGTHRPMTDSELAAKVGAQLAAQFDIVNSSSTAASEMAYLGTSSSRIPVWVNRTVAEADLRIGLGMITPHMDVGFSGGAKIILPGVCSSLTVDAFHAAGALIPENQLGKGESSIRASLETFVSEHVPLDFILNAIITPEGSIYRCVSGHAVQAQRAGVAHAKAVFDTAVRQRYPVVVANCHPYDMDWWQSSKGACCGGLVTADGGTLVLVTAAPEGNSTYPLVPYYASQDIEDLKREIETRHAQDLKQAAAGLQISNLKRRVNLMLVSEGMRSTDAEMMGMAYYDTVEAAIADAIGKLPESQRNGSVALIPCAGIALPVVGEESKAGSR